MRIRTLRGRLYFLLSQWLVVYLAASSLIGYWSLQRFRAHVEEDRLLLARTVSQYLNSTLLADLQSAARLASELPAVDEEAIPQLRAFRFQGPFRDAVHLVDGSGRARVSDPPFARLPEIDWGRHRNRMSVTGLLGDGRVRGLGFVRSAGFDRPGPRVIRHRIGLRPARQRGAARSVPPSAKTPQAFPRGPPARPVCTIAAIACAAPLPPPRAAIPGGKRPCPSPTRNLPRPAGRCTPSCA